jgi:hypothetical protein
MRVIAAVLSPGSSDMNPSFGAKFKFFGSVSTPILCGWQQLQTTVNITGLRQ